MPNEEQHSWFEKLTGFNPGDAIKKVEDAGSAALKKAEDVIPGFKQAEAVVSSGVKTVEKVVSGGVQKVKDAVGKPADGAKKQSPAEPSSAGGGGTSGGGVLSLTGSVGRGGQNKLDDVKAVQSALNQRAGAGLGVDGKCGPATIKAIEAFQKSVGQAKPDGRIDPGKGTARALAGGGGPAVAPTQPSADPSQPEPKPPGGPGGGSPLSSSQLGALTRAGLDVDFDGITSCPGPATAFAVAVIGVELVGLDMALLAVAGGVEGAMAKVVASKAAALLAIPALLGMKVALETLADAAELWINCAQSHKLDASKLKAFEKLIRTAVGIAQKQIDKLKKEFSGD